MFVFLPVSDMESYADYDLMMGYGGNDQLNTDDGIIVLKTREDDFRSLVEQFEEYMTK